MSVIAWSFTKISMSILWSSRFGGTRKRNYAQVTRIIQYHHLVEGSVVTSPYQKYCDNYLIDGQRHLWMDLGHNTQAIKVSQPSHPPPPWPEGGGSIGQYGQRTVSRDKKYISCIKMARDIERKDGTIPIACKSESYLCLVNLSITYEDEKQISAVHFEPANDSKEHNKIFAEGGWVAPPPPAPSWNMTNDLSPPPPPHPWRSNSLTPHNSGHTF